MPEEPQRDLVTPEDRQEARPLLEQGFNSHQAAALLRLRRAVQRGERGEADVAPRTRHDFVRWLVRTGRLREW